VCHKWQCHDRNVKPLLAHGFNMSGPAVRAAPATPPHHDYVPSPGQGQEGFLRLFPGWPGDSDAAFSSLRMKGALLVSATYKGQAQWAGKVAGTCR
jgi:hypothetical protein